MIFQTEPENFNPRFQIVGCYLEHDGKILLLHRHENKSQGGKWGFPAGKREAGESESEAMAREIKEETGLLVSLDDLQYHGKVFVRHAGAAYDFIYHAFSMKFTSKPEVNIDSYEHQGFDWIHPQEALSINLVEDTGNCLKLFHEVSS